MSCGFATTRQAVPPSTSGISSISSYNQNNNSNLRYSRYNHSGRIPSEVITMSGITAEMMSQQQQQQSSEQHHRAIHRIHLDAITHNFSCVESTATRQRCSVIVVVKGDGYGHGAINIALHLADFCGADSFAVATLEEAVALRKAFDHTYPGQQYGLDHSINTSTNTTSTNHHHPPALTENKNNDIFSLFAGPPEGCASGTNANVTTGTPSTAEATSVTGSSDSDSSTGVGGNTGKMTGSGTVTGVISKVRLARPNFIRIIVLGPPVGFPRCFDDYYHYDIDVMVSGPEVAASIMQWVLNSEERRRLQVEKVANETKEKALKMNEARTNNIMVPNHHPLRPQGSGTMLSATLSNVSGQDLAKEVRNLLISQHAAKQKKEQSHKHQQQHHHQQQQQQQQQQQPPPPPQQQQPSQQVSKTGNASTNIANASSSVNLSVTNSDLATGTITESLGQPFGGIEAAAKNSRTREKAAARANGIFLEDSDSSNSATNQGNSNTAARTISTTARKTLRWHALVDSGMGRLGFKTQPVVKADVGIRRDTVEIIHELVDMEMENGSPVEFCGMCTHMAEANSSSSYTQEQIARFKGLLRRVRAAGISIPTVSTDNSAALLTPTLTHFDPKEILSQPDVGTPTRGYVRTGAAIFGQRPAFTQLRAVSTLLASVRHVAVLRKGESVGYDRNYIAPMDVRIATLTIGFADGLPRELGNGVGKVEIRRQVFPIAGNVCMDMIMVELGPAEQKTGVAAEIVVGDTAVLWGPLHSDDGEGLVRLQDIANTLKTTQSALTCGLDKVRVLRQFV